jgi:hypothetical protein
MKEKKLFLNVNVGTEFQSLSLPPSTYVGTSARGEKQTRIIFRTEEKNARGVSASHTVNSDSETGHTVNSDSETGQTVCKHCK